MKHCMLVCVGVRVCLCVLQRSDTFVRFRRKVNIRSTFIATFRKVVVIFCFFFSHFQRETIHAGHRSNAKKSLFIIQMLWSVSLCVCVRMFDWVISCVGRNGSTCCGFRLKCFVSVELWRKTIFLVFSLVCHAKIEIAPSLDT